MFEEFIPKSYSASAIPDDKCGVSVRKGPRNSTLVTFKIGAKVAKDLSWDTDDKVSVFWGMDTDMGKVRIQLTAAGGRSWTVRGDPAKGFRITVSQFPPAYAREGRNRQIVSHEVLEMRTDPGPRLIMTLPPAMYRKNRKAA